ncbi:MAG: DHH family phosphoesterase [Phycisphaerales bacterium]|nr:DHH family phosphoesterase [Phycisphaerales bacterium]
MSDYRGNSTPDQTAAWLKSRKKVVVCTHAKPDGDALGSTVGLSRALAHAGIPSEVWLIGPFAEWTDKVVGTTPVCRLSSENTQIPPSGADADGIAVCDTGSWNQLEGLRPWLTGKAMKTAILDHHLHGNAEVADRRLIVTAAAAASHIVADVATLLLGLAPGAPLPLDVATPLYLGLATDTGWLRFSNTTPDTLRLAARLLDSGVDHAALYEMVEQQQKPIRPVLLGKALGSLSMHHGKRLAMMTIRDRDLRELGAVGEDTGGFSEPVLAVAGVQVVATLTEMPPPQSAPAGSGLLVKVSLRSKPGPDAVDVAAVANRLGGGGHARAAGVKLFTSIEEAQRTIVQAFAPAAP